MLVGGSAAVYNVAIGRMLGPTVLGHAGLALSIGLGIAQIATSGIGPATTRFAALHRAMDDHKSAGWAVRRGILATLVVSALCAAGLLAVPTTAVQAIDLPKALAGPAALLILLQALYIALKAALYGMGAVRQYFRAEVAAASAFLGGLAVLLLGRPSSLLLPFLVANAVFIIVAAAVVARLLARTSDRGTESTVKAVGRASAVAGRVDEGPTAEAPGDSMLRYGAIAMVGSVAALARLQLPILLLGLWWGAEQAGLLQAATVFLPVVLLLPRALELALFPRLAASFARDEPRAFRRKIAAAQEALTPAIGLGAGALLIVGPYLLIKLYGAGFSGSFEVLDRVVLAAWAIGLATPAIAALSGADRVSVPNASGVAALIVSLVAWTVLIPDRGAIGAATGLALGSVVILVVPLAAAARIYGVPLQRSTRAFVRTGLLLIVCLFVTRVVGWPSLAVAAAFLVVGSAIEAGQFRAALDGLRSGTAS